jgi:hypothetical protein
MVDFNATLLLQAFHFLLVWWLLDRFLFRDVVRIIQKERAACSKVASAIDRNKAALAAEQRKQDLIWLQYRKKFGKYAPEIEMSPLLSFSSILCPVIMKMKDDEKALLLSQAKSFLVKKVTNV